MCTSSQYLLLLVVVLIFFTPISGDQLTLSGYAYLDSNCTSPLYDLSTINSFEVSPTCQSYYNIYSIKAICTQTSIHTDLEFSFYNGANCNQHNLTEAFSFISNSGPNTCIPGTFTAGGSTINAWATINCNGAINPSQSTGSLPPSNVTTTAPYYNPLQYYSNVSILAYTSQTCTGSSAFSYAYAFPDFSSLCVTSPTFSYVFDCIQNSTHTEFLFAAYNTSACIGKSNAIEYFYFSGGGRDSCLQGGILVNGYTLPLSAKVQCNINGNNSQIINLSGGNYYTGSIPGPTTTTQSTGQAETSHGVNHILYSSSSAINQTDMGDRNLANGGLNNMQIIMVTFSMIVSVLALLIL